MASSEELQQLKWVGRSKAWAIIKDRKANGAYIRVDEL